jgi:malonate decarboxylase delta subunit
METIHFEFPAGSRLLERNAHVGVVASGNLEILLEPEFSHRSKVRVRTSVTGYRDEWLAILRTFFERHDVAASIEINDGGASPPIVMLRLEQALDISGNEGR